MLWIEIFIDSGSINRTPEYLCTGYNRSYTNFAAALGYGEDSTDEIALRRYLQQIADEADYEKWFFGHFHEDEIIEDIFYALYDELSVVE